MTNILQAAALPERGIVTVSGAERIKFLQGLTTNDIRRLAPGRPLYAGFLTGHGKLLYDAFLIDDGDRVLIDIARSLAGDFVKRLTGLKLRAKVEIGEPTPALAVAAIWGTQAAAPSPDTIEAAVGDRAPGTRAFVDPRIAALGVRLVYPAERPIDAALERLGVRRVNASDYETFRLSLGIADTAEIAGETCYPLEANFVALNGVDFKKGCYIGQELTARMKLKGGLRKRILPVHGAGDLPAVETQVMAGTTKLGPLIATRGTRGLALLRLDHLAEAGDDVIRAGDIVLTVDWPDWLSRAS